MTEKIPSFRVMLDEMDFSIKKIKLWCLPSVCLCWKDHREKKKNWNFNDNAGKMRQYQNQWMLMIEAKVVFFSSQTIRLHDYVKRWLFGFWTDAYYLLYHKANKVNR